MTIQFDLQTAAQAVNGRLLGDNAAFVGVSTDTRSVRAGELFIALCGERFDAHEFIATARERGAVAALVSENSLNHPAVVAVAEACRAAIVLDADARGVIASTDNPRVDRFVEQACRDAGVPVTARRARSP